MNEPTKAPKSIYLQYESDDCTWCVDQVCDDDVKYIRADLVTADRERLKSLDAQAVPVEPEWVIQSRKSKKLGFSGDYSHLDYIDALQSALQRAHTERKNWQETARQYAGNSDYWRERAEKAEALAGEWWN